MKTRELERLMELLARFYEIAPDDVRVVISHVRFAVDEKIEERR